MVFWATLTHAWSVGSSYPMNLLIFYIMSSTSSHSWVLPHSVPSGGVVPHDVPPLPLPIVPSKCAHFSANHKDCISPNLLCPHVSASDRFTFWLSPFGIAQINSQSYLFPPEIIICRWLVMANCILPNTQKPCHRPFLLYQNLR